MFLFRLHTLALRLWSFLPWCLVLMLGSIALAVFVLFRGGAQASLTLGIALMLALWALLLFAFINLFQAIPAPVLPRDTWFERLLSRIKLALYHLLALGVLVVGLVVILMSLKLLSVAAG